MVMHNIATQSPRLRQAKDRSRLPFTKRSRSQVAINGDGTMSGQHVSDMAMSFVEMAKAFEELPKVKAELAEANRAFNHASDTIQRLELKLIDRNTTIDELHAKVRETEVARDDAELRFLEADDKLNRVAVALQTAGETVGLALQRPEPVKVEEPITEYKGETPLDVSTTSETPSSEPLTVLPSHAGPSLQSQVEAPSTGSESLTPEGGELPPEPFSLESKPTDQVEVREEANPTVQLDSTQSTTVSSETAAMVETALPETAAPGQSDPLPTAASPIDGSTAGSTNANPSGDASSQIDDPSYDNEPRDKWTVAWTHWAGRMDAKFGRYNWPMRTSQA